LQVRAAADGRYRRDERERRDEGAGRDQPASVRADWSGVRERLMKSAAPQLDDEAKPMQVAKRSRQDPLEPVISS
jgi:hypothetical protein